VFASVFASVFTSATSLLVSITFSISNCQAKLFGSISFSVWFSSMVSQVNTSQVKISQVSTFSFNKSSPDKLFINKSSSLSSFVSSILSPVSSDSKSTSFPFFITDIICHISSGYILLRIIYHQIISNTIKIKTFIPDHFFLVFFFNSLEESTFAHSGTCVTVCVCWFCSHELLLFTIIGSNWLDCII